jgi:hypothetical protein
LVYPLKAKSLAPEFDSPVDYAGYCINLAVRLQDHCPEIGFIVHEPVLPKLDGLIKWVAHGMKGIRSEPVLVFATDFPPMSVEKLKSKFAPTGSESDLRVKALSPEKQSSEAIALIQPRLEAQLVGPGRLRQCLFLDQAYPEFMPVREVKDCSGKVLRREMLVFRLVSEGPPLTYDYVRSEPRL